MEVFAQAVTEELRPGRPLRLLHHRAVSRRPAARVLFCHGSMASMIQYGENIKYVIDRGDVDVLAYDWLGCGDSAKPYDWTAYAGSELLADLRAAYERLLGTDGGKDGVPVIVVAHSYGTALAIQLTADLVAANSEPSAPSVLFLMSGGTGEVAAKATGVFCLPLFLLRWLQPVMSRGFKQMSLHPSTDEAIKELSSSVSEKNQMHVCKAFYRHMPCPWTQPQVVAAASGVPALFLHGDSDGVIPVEEAQRIASCFTHRVFRVIGPASHQVMMEQSSQTNAMLQKLIDNSAAGLEALAGLAEMPVNAVSEL